MIGTPFVFHFNLMDADSWKECSFRDGYFSGRHINALLTNDSSESFDPGEYGEWLNIKILKKYLEIEIDLLGFYRLFYYHLGDDLIVSNDFDSLVIYLKSKNVTLIANNVLSKLMFSINANYFNNMISEDTFCEQIKVLEPGQKIVFEDEKLALKTEDVYDASGRISGDLPYNELIDAGIQHFQETLLKYTSLGRIVNLHLSGGYDSRVCLALLLSCMDASSIFVTTAYPNETLNKSVRETIEKDFVIACTICDDFGIPLYSKKEEIALRLGYSSNLSCLKNFINNNYFPVSMSSKRIVGDFNVVEIRGGAGELLRGSEYLDGLKGILIGNDTSIDEDLKLIYDSFTKNEKHLTELEREYFYKKNKRYPGNNIFEKFDYRFISSRNNRHFGHHRRSYSEGKHTFHPLANPYFIKASRYLSYADRKSGKLALDIISKLENKLLSIPFASNLTSNTEKNVFSLPEAKEFFGKELLHKKNELISMTNRDGMNTESLCNNLYYMSKRAEYLERNNIDLKKMFSDIRTQIESKNKFDAILHNKLFSFLSLHEPNYSNYLLLKNEIIE